MDFGRLVKQFGASRQKTKVGAGLKELGLVNWLRQACAPTLVNPALFALFSTGPH